MALKKKAPAKKLGPKTLMPNRKTDKPAPKINMPLKPSDKPGVRVNMAKKVKKVKVEGPGNYTPNSSVYQLPMTPAQQRAFGKLNMSPKTSQTLFTVPKGTTGMSQKEIDQMQARRVADRKRTLARAEAIIRRTK